MLTGAPLPLSPDIPIRRLLALTDATPGAGAWVRDAPRELRIRLRAPGCHSKLLVSRDLGLLLRRCRKIVLRSGTDAVVLEADVLIRWRALQVVTGIPCLPQPRLLKEIFPEAYWNTAGFAVPVGERAPEEVLAQCVKHGIPVVESRIVYACRAVPPVDVMPPGHLR